MRLSCLALAHRCPPRSEEALKPTRTLLALCCYHENATQTLTRCERGRRWKVSTRQKSPKHQDQDSLAEARVGRRLAKRIVSSRSVPCHFNLVYLHAVLSLGMHATCARIKVRPQGDMHLFPALLVDFLLGSRLNGMNCSTRPPKQWHTGHTTLLYPNASHKQHVFYITSE